MVVCVVGDGGIQMLLGELGTLAETHQKVVVVILNNNLLGMVRELQDNAYGPKGHFGIHYGISPDFIKIGEGYGIPGRMIHSHDQIDMALDEAMATQGSFIIDCRIDETINSL